MKMKIQYIGHSTFHISIDIGNQLLSIITDPWFDKGSFILKRVSNPALSLNDIQKCDLMLVSHSHTDHFDSLTLGHAKNNWKPTIIGPKSVVKKANKFGLQNTITVFPGESFDISGIKVNVVRALHPIIGGRDAVGYILRLDNMNIYFSGDTIYSDDVVKEIKDFKIRIALLPVGAAKFLSRKVVMDVHDAMRFALEINPEIVIPMHYNALKGTEADPEKIRNTLSDKGIELKVLNPGDIIWAD